MIATLRWNTMRVDGARFRAGERFVVAREFTAMGDNGPVRCLTLVHQSVQSADTRDGATGFCGCRAGLVTAASHNATDD